MENSEQNIMYSNISQMHYIMSPADEPYTEHLRVHYDTHRANRLGIEAHVALVFKYSLQQRPPSVFCLLSSVFCILPYVYRNYICTVNYLWQSDHQNSKSRKHGCHLPFPQKAHTHRIWPIYAALVKQYTYPCCNRSIIELQVMPISELSSISYPINAIWNVGT